MAKYFSDEEIKGLDSRLVILLDQWRDKAGIPIIITSGLRTQEQNTSLSTSIDDTEVVKGSVSDSAHLKGLAVDIRCSDSSSRFKLVTAALEVGFKRIEIATRHLHVDIDESKPQNIIFLGISK